VCLYDVFLGFLYPLSFFFPQACPPFSQFPMVPPPLLLSSSSFSDMHCSLSPFILQPLPFCQFVCFLCLVFFFFCFGILAFSIALGQPSPCIAACANVCKHPIISLSEIWGPWILPVFVRKYFANRFSFFFPVCNCLVNNFCLLGTAFGAVYYLDRSLRLISLCLGMFSYSFRQICWLPKLSSLCPRTRLCPQWSVHRFVPTTIWRRWNSFFFLLYLFSRSAFFPFFPSHYFPFFMGKTSPKNRAPLTKNLRPFPI